MISMYGSRSFSDEVLEAASLQHDREKVRCFAVQSTFLRRGCAMYERSDRTRMSERALDGPDRIFMMLALQVTFWGVRFPNLSHVITLLR
jgi:hypothetical protein